MKLSGGRDGRHTVYYCPSDTAIRLWCLKGRLRLWTRKNLNRLLEGLIGCAAMLLGLWLFCTLTGAALRALGVG